MQVKSSTLKVSSNISEVQPAIGSWNDILQKESDLKIVQ